MRWISNWTNDSIARSASVTVKDSNWETVRNISSGLPDSANANARQAIARCCPLIWTGNSSRRARIFSGDSFKTIIASASGPGPTGAIKANLSVTDEGHGMTQDVASRIFEPFFTTRPVGEGTGLGLPVVHGIIESLRGTITLDSTPGLGSTFTVRFPLAEDPAAVNPQQQEAGAGT
jgi:signal transduction histidine kinase